MNRKRRARLWLACGAAIGLALAAQGMLRGPTSALPTGVVAMVGEVPITTEEYARALAAVESDRRAAPDRALQRHVLDRLIDEELLVQAALESGLAVRDPALRGQIASAMIDAVLGPRPAPTEEELRAHYAANAGLFARNGRVRVEAFWFDQGDTRARAAAARARLLAGQPVTDADAPVIIVPTGSLPQVKLTDYLGPVVARTVGTTPVGAVTEPLEISGGRWVVRVLERKDGEVPAFEVVREQVLADLRRARDDEALRRWLDRRRLDTRVAVREPLP